MCPNKFFARREENWRQMKNYATEQQRALVDGWTTGKNLKGAMPFHNLRLKLLTPN